MCSVQKAARPLLRKRARCKSQGKRRATVSSILSFRLMPLEQYILRLSYLQVVTFLRNGAKLAGAS